MSILNINNRCSRGLLSAALSFGLFSFSSLIAQQGLAQNAQPSVEQRQAMAEHHKKMAEMHSKMASCVASDLPIVECRQQLRDTSNSIMRGRREYMGGGPKSMMGNGMMDGSRCIDWMSDTESENTQKNPKSEPKN